MKNQYIGDNGKETGNTRPLNQYTKFANDFKVHMYLVKYENLIRTQFN